jgi:hypothetical protein
MHHRTASAGNAGKFDILALEKDALLVGWLTGVLDAKTAEMIVEFIETREIAVETGFNRFCDLTRLEGIHLSSEDVYELATRRRAFNPNDILVKSAFLAKDPLAFGVARMYEQMLNSKRIHVRVWSDRQAAADWLEVDPDRLTL